MPPRPSRISRFASVSSTSRVYSSSVIDDSSRLEIGAWSVTARTIIRSVGGAFASKLTIMLQPAAKPMSPKACASRYVTR